MPSGRTRPSLAALRRATLNFNNYVRKLRANKIQGPVNKYNLTDMETVFLRYGGRCVYCGLPLRMQDGTGICTLNFVFYNHPHLGGPWNLDNVVTVCTEHTKYTSTDKRLREDIPDISTFADLLEQLVRGVIVVERQLETGSADLHKSIEKVRRIKRLVNMNLEDIALSMRVRAFRDWEPESYEVIQEGENSFPDLVEKVAQDRIRHEDEKVLESDKAAIENQTKQIIKTKQYKVVRND